MSWLCSLPTAQPPWPASRGAEGLQQLGEEPGLQPLPPHQSAGSSRAKDERAVARVGKQGREQLKRRAGQMTAGLEL